MSTGLHKNLAIGEIHSAIAYQYADATARTSATGFVAADIGKLAHQTDNDTVWLLTATTPTWVEITGMGPSAHALGGASHSADTLANLNAKISDATLIDTGDARLSDDRTASGVRTATTVVAVSAAAAPTVGQVLKATSGTAATWQDEAGGASLTNSAPADVTKAAAAVGVSTEAARADHKHDISTAAAVAVGTANAEGVASSLARSDHTHQVTGLVISSQAQGDVLYFNGTAWVRLAPGTPGQFLKTLGAAANPAWDTAGGTAVDDENAILASQVFG